MDIENVREKGNESSIIQSLSELERPDIEMFYTYLRPAYYSTFSCTTFRDDDGKEIIYWNFFLKTPSSTLIRKTVHDTFMFKYHPQVSWSNWVWIRRLFGFTLISGNFAWNWTYTKEYFLGVKRNELSSYGKRRRKLKYILSERCHSEKATYCMFPIIWHSGKDKIIEIVKISVVARI